MWIRHVLSFAATCLSYFFTAIRGTVLGWVLDLVFLGGIAFLTLRALHSNEGWAAMVTHWEKEKKVAIRYAIWCSLIIYGPVALWKVGQAIYDDHMNLVGGRSAQSRSYTTERTLLVDSFGRCQVELQSVGSSLRDKQSLADSLQVGITALQGPQAQQAANISTCINVLAKMNPKVYEQINVISVPVGTIDFLGKFVKAALVTKSITELIIVTNEPETRFHGFLKCEHELTFQSYPALITTRQTAMSTESPPIKAANGEWEILVQAGGEWAPANPAYMKVMTTESNPGSCSFRNKF